MDIIIQDIEEIKIPEHRHRKTFIEQDIQNLSDSIMEHGLFHAPVVLGDGVTLVAGERRLRAVKLLANGKTSFTYDGREVELGKIPVIRIVAEDEIAVREAELSENIDRVSLSWREKSAAADELHRLRTTQKEAVGEKQTKKATAEELYGGKGAGIASKLQDVTKDLIVAKFMSDPDVAKAKTREDALKVIEKKVEAKRREELGKEYDMSGTTGDHQIILGDMLEELPKLEHNKISCIIADPPYGIGADKFQNQAASKHVYKDDEAYGNAMGGFILKECLALSKKEAHLYMFLDINRFLYWKEVAEKVGWYVWNKPLIWFRGVNSGIAPRPAHGPRNTYEAIMYCIKGDKETKIQGAPDMLDVPHERGINYAAHKPAELYERLIKRSCDAGDWVLDPVCGSGPIFAAAVKLNVLAIGIDSNEVAVSHCYDRLKGE